MHLGFAQGHTDAENGALAIEPNAQSDEHGTVQQAAALTDLLVTGVDEHVRKTAQWAIAPGFQFSVQLGGTLADLGGTDRVAAELLDDGGDFAGGDALDVHLGKRHFERLLAADAFFERVGIELQIAAHLGDIELDRADARGQRFGFEAVGVALAGVSALVGLGLEGVRAFPDHRFIDEQAKTFGEAFGALFGQQLQDGVQ